MDTSETVYFSVEKKDYKTQESIINWNTKLNYGDGTYPKTNSYSLEAYKMDYPYNVPNEKHIMDMYNKYYIDIDLWGEHEVNVLDEPFELEGAL